MRNARCNTAAFVKTCLTKLLPWRGRWKRYTRQQLYFNQMLLVMKFTAFFLLVACLQVSAHSVAQGISLSEKNAPLSAVFQKIEKQTGYTFWYENVLLKNTYRVNLELRNASLGQVLD